LTKTSASASTGHIKRSHVDFPAFSLFTKAGNVNEEHKHGTGTVQKQFLFNTNILPNALQT
jgi:hypothetical protein